MEDISWVINGSAILSFLKKQNKQTKKHRNATAKNILQDTQSEHTKRVKWLLFIFMIFERRTNLGLCYQGAFSITQRREGQAEFQLSITLTKIEKERRREDILKGLPHSSENNFLKVIWFHRLGLPRCSNRTVREPFWKSLWREASLTSYFERLQHLLHSLLFFCSSRGPSSENRQRCTAPCFWT